MGTSNNIAVAIKHIENSVELRDNMGGIPSFVYYGFARDVETWPELPELDATTDVDVFNELDSVPVLATGKTIRRLYVSPQTGEVKSALVGPTDGKSHKYTLDITHPGTQKEIAGFTRLVKNAGLFFLVPDENRPGEYQMMGSKFQPAKMATNEATTGKKTEDLRGRVTTFESFGRGECPYVAITEADLAVLLGE